MSAKKSKQGPNQPVPVVPAPAPAGPAPAPAAEVSSSWLESSDPRKRLWGRIIFAALWVYVGALWLLALDQTFHWGIFGPKVPPLP